MKMQPRPVVTLAEIAEHGLGLRATDLPRGEDELRAVIIAETVRLGLCHQYERSGNMPVHHSSVRNWVGRKLEAAMPDLFGSEDTIDYRDVLIESGGNMEYLGDVLSLKGGMLCPAPTRVVHAGGSDYVLTSGLPTSKLPLELRPFVKFNMMGRRLVNVTGSLLEKASIRTRKVETFLNVKRHATSPIELLQSILRQDSEEWRSDERWECYQGYDRDVFDMKFRSREHSIPAGGGSLLQLWRRPLGRTYHEYWLRDVADPQKVYRIGPAERIRTCIALDYLTGDPRLAFMNESNGEGIVKLSFNPWGLFWRWLLLQGARPLDRQGPNRAWVVPRESLPQGADLLSRVGVRVVRT